jgi:hypothetical protein
MEGIESFDEIRVFSFWADATNGISKAIRIYIRLMVRIFDKGRKGS